ncbi:bifunctional riboflavin kinase/FAD synthetase [Algihabitans albus]|uniref:bifunctional riboflavin kinase/FAD synthetase n=1 Tax=Algihabitans albus TaxID=2164067 RepID=UPI000E5D5A9A|nr:bifunctional riboflavin kinase/FAD synthetase [Algihabitans albus]
MQLYRHHSSVPSDGRGAVVAVGNFDGVHRGHQAVIEIARAKAKELGAPLGVLTFEPHPRLFFQPDQPPFRLTAFRTKARLLQTLGVERLYCLPFTRRLAGLEAADFIAEVLTAGLGLRHVVVGDNFRFGRKRGGDPALLERAGKSAGFGTTVVRRVGGSLAEAYSSTQVRSYLADGNPTRAALMLGRYWEIEGRVRHGAKRGRTLGFPTANIPLRPSLLRPAYGVYAVRAALEEATSESRVWFPGVANLGIAPMYGYDEPLLETFLFDYSGNLYGRHLRIALVDYLRPEQRFETVEALTAQMASDCEKARQTLVWEDWRGDWPAGPFVRRGAPPGEGVAPTSGS